VLDAGCGTGRVALELARRGVEVIGTDLDPEMLAIARANGAGIEWIEADLATLEAAVGPERWPTFRFDLVVMAGNVIPYVAAADRPAAVAGAAGCVAPGGRLVAGFQLRPGWPELADYDRWCAAAGLVLEHRWATWDRKPFEPVVDGAPAGYAVSVHRRPASPT
jgi:SAM-dependent methyltransferase